MGINDKDISRDHAKLGGYVGGRRNDFVGWSWKKFRKKTFKGLSKGMAVTMLPAAGLMDTVTYPLARKKRKWGFTKMVMREVKR